MSAWVTLTASNLARRRQTKENRPKKEGRSETEKDVRDLVAVSVICRKLNDLFANITNKVVAKRLS